MRKLILETELNSEGPDRTLDLATVSSGRSPIFLASDFLLFSPYSESQAIDAFFFHFPIFFSFFHFQNPAQPFTYEGQGAPRKTNESFDANLSTDM